MPEPQAGIDIGLVAAMMFIFAVGVTVGCDVTFTGLLRTAKTQFRPFAAGVCCQFGVMPFIGFLLSVAVPADQAFCNKSSLALAVLLPGCMPGGTTSNLLTLLVGGNVELSILMSVFSNVVAIFMIPLLVLTYYESQYGNDAAAVKVPYMSIISPLLLMLVGLFLGLFVKRYTDEICVRLTKKAGMIFSIVFLCGNMLLGFVFFLQHPVITVPFAICAIFYQPLGYTFGFLLAKFAFRIGLRDSLTVSIETGVQNWSLPLAIALFAFDIEDDKRIIADLLFNGAYGPMTMYVPHCGTMILLFRWITRKYDPPSEATETKEEEQAKSDLPNMLATTAGGTENTLAKDAQSI